MVHLKILSGQRAGSTYRVERFPCLIGRSAASQICLEDGGVWDRHFEITLLDSGSFALKRFPDASLILNGESIQEAILRNGDLVEAGAVKCQFWLADTRQRSLRPRELMTWLALTLLSLGQIYLIYLLLR